MTEARASPGEGAVAERRLPRLPLPEPLRARDGGFTYTSVYQRLPDILRRLLVENTFPSDVVTEIQKMVAEIESQEGRISLIPDDGGPDVTTWQTLTNPHVGELWNDIPWYFGEAYMYRRVLYIIGYFKPDSPWFRKDPFEPHKTKSFVSELEPIRSLIETAESLDRSKGMKEEDFITVLEAALWGNRVDLSVKPGGPDKGAAVIDAHKDFLIVDDSIKIWELVKTAAGARFDFIIDNAGLELASDLVLADYLLSSNLAASVTFHLKGYPLFVSDALDKDVRYTVDQLAADDESSAARALATRLSDYLSSGRLVLKENFYWTQPTGFWEMPDPLRADISAAFVVFVKGDANYRRLGGDRHWPYTTALSDVASYFPAPFVSLRTNKSGTIAAGPDAAAAIDAAAQKDPNWLVSGKYGVIQLVVPS